MPKQQQIFIILIVYCKVSENNKVKRNDPPDNAHVRIQTYVKYRIKKYWIILVDPPLAYFFHHALRLTTTINLQKFDFIERPHQA